MKRLPMDAVLKESRRFKCSSGSEAVKKWYFVKSNQVDLLFNFGFSGSCGTVL